MESISRKFLVYLEGELQGGTFHLLCIGLLKSEMSISWFFRWFLKMIKKDETNEKNKFYVGVLCQLMPHSFDVSLHFGLKEWFLSTCVCACVRICSLD
jgi:hypothetical protein